MKNYLIIRLSALGDVAMVCAAIREAAILHPENQYTLMTRPRMKGLMSVMPENVHFHPFGEWIEWGKYDIIVDLHRVWRSLGICLRAALHLKKIRRLHKPRLGRWQVVHGKREALQETMLDKYRRLLDLPAERAALPLPIEVKKKEGVGVAPFAAHPGKVYPLDRMEQVVRLLSEQGETVKLFGYGPEETKILQDWEAKYEGVESMCGKHPMSDELKIMASLRVMLSMDSGNMHMASLVGTRVVSVWGATAPSLGFVGCGQKSADCVQRTDISCHPCSAYGKKACKYGDHRCMLIDPQTIVDQLNKEEKVK